MRTIKRYGNRKLYDTREKRYLTLAHLSELVAQGEKVQVVDNDSGEDITGVVFSKALIDKEKGSKGFLPTELFSSLLQRASALQGAPEKVLGYLRSSWEQGRDQVKELEGVVDARLQGLIDRGKLTAKDAVRFRDQVVDGLKDRWAAIEAGVEKRVSAALQSLPIASRRDVERLEERIGDLADRVEALATPVPARSSRPAAKAPARRPARTGRPARPAARRRRAG